MYLVKRFAVLILYISVGAIIFYSLRSTEFVDSLLYIYPCKEPISYKIGNIDQKFDTSREYLQTTASSAASIWNAAAGKNYFKYNPSAQISINLIYDERQTYVNQVNELNKKLNTGKESLDSAIAQYQSDAAKFQDRLNKLNEQVTYWNERGGAPSEEYDKLNKEQQVLEEEANRLNATAKILNQSTGAFNVGVRKLNQTVDTLNTLLDTKPEQGIYDPNNNRIDIYFANNQQELIRTIAHELGHARGLDHISNKEALMYFRTTKKAVVTPDDLASLYKYCTKRNVINELKDNVEFILKDNFRRKE